MLSGEEDHRLAKQSTGLDAGLIPVTVPELLRLLRDTVIPPPRRDRPHRLAWSAWRRRHQHRAREAHRRWNAYAEMSRITVAGPGFSRQLAPAGSSQAVGCRCS